MKYIFDFDDVVFHSTKKFKEYMYACLEEEGIPRAEAEAYYKKKKDNPEGLRELLAHFSVNESLYEKIMKESENFVNTEVVELIKKLGKENCYIVTLGEREFQLDKIKRTGIAHLFRDIVVVRENKKHAIENIAEKHKDEGVYFIDDKAHHFEELDLKSYPNLKTIHYDENGLEKLRFLIKTPGSEEMKGLK